VQQIQ
jgi:hypothetical protein